MEGATDYKGCVRYWDSVDSHHEERRWLLVSYYLLVYYSSSFHFPTFFKKVE